MSTYGPASKDKKTLIIGCGGGYDIFCGLPLYYALNNNAILANFSFTNEALLERGNSNDIGPGFWEIDATTLTLPTKQEFLNEVSLGEGEQDKKPPQWLLKQLGITLGDFQESKAGLRPDGVNGLYYFPEWSLSQQLGHSVWTFNGNRGGRCITDGLKNLIKRYGIQQVILVDGGTDSLMKGDEEELGTQFEDMLSMAGLSQAVLEIATDSVDGDSHIDMYLYTLGYNIDSVHHVTNESVDANILEAIKDGGFRGAYHILNDPLAAGQYRETFMACYPASSWINSLVTAGLIGLRPDTTPDWILEIRGKSLLPISPIMGLYWAFDLRYIVSKKTWDMPAIAETVSEASAEGLLGSKNY